MATNDNNDYLIIENNIHSLITQVRFEVSCNKEKIKSLSVIKESINKYGEFLSKLKLIIDKLIAMKNLLLKILDIVGLRYKYEIDCYLEQLNILYKLFYVLMKKKKNNEDKGKENNVDGSTYDVSLMLKINSIIEKIKNSMKIIEEFNNNSNHSNYIDNDKANNDAASEKSNHSHYSHYSNFSFSLIKTKIMSYLDFINKKIFSIANITNNCKRQKYSNNNINDTNNTRNTSNIKNISLDKIVKETKSLYSSIVSLKTKTESVLKQDEDILKSINKEISVIEKEVFKNNKVSNDKDEDDNKDEDILGLNFDYELNNISKVLNDLVNEVNIDSLDENNDLESISYTNESKTNLNANVKKINNTNLKEKTIKNYIDYDINVEDNDDIHENKYNYYKDDLDNKEIFSNKGIDNSIKYKHSTDNADNTYNNQNLELKDNNKMIIDDDDIYENIEVVSIHSHVNKEDTIINNDSSNTKNNDFMKESKIKESGQKEHSISTFKSNNLSIEFTNEKRSRKASLISAHKNKLESNNNDTIDLNIPNNLSNLNTLESHETKSQLSKNNRLKDKEISLLVEDEENNELNNDLSNIKESSTKKSNKQSLNKLETNDHNNTTKSNINVNDNTNSRKSSNVVKEKSINNILSTPKSKMNSQRKEDNKDNGDTMNKDNVINFEAKSKKTQTNKSSNTKTINNDDHLEYNNNNNNSDIKSSHKNKTFNILFPEESENIRNELESILSKNERKLSEYLEKERKDTLYSAYSKLSKKKNNLNDNESNIKPISTISKSIKKQSSRKISKDSLKNNSNNIEDDNKSNSYNYNNDNKQTSKKCIDEDEDPKLSDSKSIHSKTSHNTILSKKTKKTNYCNKNKEIKSVHSRLEKKLSIIKEEENSSKYSNNNVASIKENKEKSDNEDKYTIDNEVSSFQNKQILIPSVIVSKDPSSKVEHRKNSVDNNIYTNSISNITNNNILSSNKKESRKMSIMSMKSNITKNSKKEEDIASLISNITDSDGKVNKNKEVKVDDEGFYNIEKTETKEKDNISLASYNTNQKSKLKSIKDTASKKSKDTRKTKLSTILNSVNINNNDQNDNKDDHINYNHVENDINMTQDLICNDDSINEVCTGLSRENNWKNDNLENNNKIYDNNLNNLSDINEFNNLNLHNISSNQSIPQSNNYRNQINELKTNKHRNNSSNIEISFLEENISNEEFFDLNMYNISNNEENQELINDYNELKLNETNLNNNNNNNQDYNIKEKATRQRIILSSNKKRITDLVDKKKKQLNNVKTTLFKETDNNKNKGFSNNNKSNKNNKGKNNSKNSKEPPQSMKNKSIKDFLDKSKIIQENKEVYKNDNSNDNDIDKNQSPLDLITTEEIITCHKHQKIITPYTTGNSNNNNNINNINNTTTPNKNYKVSHLISYSNNFEDNNSDLNEFDFNKDFSINTQSEFSFFSGISINNNNNNKAFPYKSATQINKENKSLLKTAFSNNNKEAFIEFLDKVKYFDYKSTQDTFCSELNISTEKSNIFISQSKLSGNNKENKDSTNNFVNNTGNRNDNVNNSFSKSILNSSNVKFLNKKRLNFDTTSRKSKASENTAKSYGNFSFSNFKNNTSNNINNNSNSNLITPVNRRKQLNDTSTTNNTNTNNSTNNNIMKLIIPEKLAIAQKLLLSKFKKPAKLITKKQFIKKIIIPIRNIHFLEYDNYNHLKLKGVDYKNIVLNFKIKMLYSINSDFDIQSKLKLNELNNYSNEILNNLYSKFNSYFENMSIGITYNVNKVVKSDTSNADNNDNNNSSNGNNKGNIRNIDFSNINLSTNYDDKNKLINDNSNESLNYDNLNISIGGNINTLLQYFYEALTKEINNIKPYVQYLFDKEKIKEPITPYKKIKIELTNFNFKEDSFTYVFQDYKSRHLSNFSYIVNNTDNKNSCYYKTSKNEYSAGKKSILSQDTENNNNTNNINNNTNTYNNTTFNTNTNYQVSLDDLDVKNIFSEIGVDYNNIEIISYAFDYNRMNKLSNGLNVFKNRLVFLMRCRELLNSVS